jgi:hypothetical protein
MSVGAFVSAQDYAQNGWGVSRPDEISDLRKALAAGSDVSDPGVAAGEGFPLRTESLESTLKNTTFEMDEIKLFKAIPKIPATNTVEEFNRLLSYGQGGTTRFDLGWMTEGDLPEEEDSTYERATLLIRYIGVTGRVTHVAGTIRPAHGNVIAVETMNKTMHLLKNLEHSLFFGDSAIIPEQIDGLYTQIAAAAPANVVDLRGGPLTEETLNDSLLQVRDNFGLATDAYFGTGAFADLAKQVYDRQRMMFGAAQPGVLGAQVTAFQGQHGKINLHDHVFIQPGPLAAAAGLGAVTKRPLPPTITVEPAAGADAASQFVAADDGTYFYRVVAVNRFGISTPVNTASVAVVAGDQVTFTIADGGQGTTGYEIYRTGPGGAVGTATLMVKVARSGATQVITDNNDDIPGTTKGFVLMQNQRSFSWAQLLPMTRVPLAAIDTSIRWAQVLYGAVKLYTPAKNLVIKNIGRAAGSL